MKKSVKVLCAILALVLTLSVGIGGTLAYLSMKSGEVKNVFTYGDLKLDLHETNNGEIVMGKDYVIVPGATLDKDPLVTISTPNGYNDVESYVFVKIDAVNWCNKVHYAIDDIAGWQIVPGESNVWYQVVTPNKDGVKINVLKGKHVTVDADLTKAEIETLTQTVKESKLNITAYAIQTATFDTPAQAWAQAQKAPPAN